MCQITEIKQEMVKTFWNQNDAWTNNGLTWIHKTYHDFGLWGKNHLPLYIILCNSLWKLYQINIFSQNVLMKILTLSSYKSSKAHNFSNFIIELKAFKKNLNSFEKKYSMTYKLLNKWWFDSSKCYLKGNESFWQFNF